MAVVKALDASADPRRDETREVERRALGVTGRMLALELFRGLQRIGRSMRR